MGQYSGPNFSLISAPAAACASSALSCFALTCELATRFLADYIVGDKYFKVKKPQHNLVRTRCQVALAKDMLNKMDAMNAIVQDCARRYKETENA